MHTWIALVEEECEIEYSEGVDPVDAELVLGEPFDTFLAKKILTSYNYSNVVLETIDANRLWSTDSEVIHKKLSKIVEVEEFEEGIYLIKITTKDPALGKDILEVLVSEFIRKSGIRTSSDGTGQVLRTVVCKRNILKIEKI
jgi:hypothetical protein